MFPFHEQMERVARDARRTARSARCARSSRASISCWTTPTTSGCSPNLAGGSIQDVGCYPIRLARLLFDAEPDLSRAIADAEWTADGADTELWGALVFPGDRRLVFSCGFRSGYDTLTRVLGTEGEIRHDRTRSIRTPTMR